MYPLAPIPSIDALSSLLAQCRKQGTFHSAENTAYGQLQIVSKNLLKTVQTVVTLYPAQQFSGLFVMVFKEWYSKT